MTRLRWIAANLDADALLRDPRQCDERKVLPAVAIVDGKIYSDSGTPTDEGLRARAPRSSGPSRTRFESRCSASRTPSEVDLVWGSRTQRLVRSIGVVQVGKRTHTIPSRGWSSTGGIRGTGEQCLFAVQ